MRGRMVAAACGQCFHAQLRLVLRQTPTDACLRAWSSLPLSTQQQLGRSGRRTLELGGRQTVTPMLRVPAQASNGRPAAYTTLAQGGRAAAMQIAHKQMPSRTEKNDCLLQMTKYQLDQQKHLEEQLKAQELREKELASKREVGV